jgi:hypothetical protein
MKCTYLVINQEWKFYDENPAKRKIHNSISVPNRIFNGLNFSFYDYQELPNQYGLDGNQIVKGLFSALVESQGDMKRAVILQPAAFSYAESLLKFAFLLNKEVCSSHFKA